MIGKLLHVCNSEPYCFGSKDDFYALKSRLLVRYADAEGYDVQKIDGKPCWSCDGSGTFYHLSGTPDTCFKCCGTGWFKHPVWVTLKRYRWGRYVFHTPEERSYQQPKPDITNISGYISHANYDWRRVRRAALVLSLLFERQIFWRLLKDRLAWSAIGRVYSRRCINCKCRLWSAERWRCARCERQPVGQETPF